MHKQEIDVKEVSKYDELMIAALYMSPKHVEALEVQRMRQLQGAVDKWEVVVKDVPRTDALNVLLTPEDWAG